MLRILARSSICALLGLTLGFAQSNHFSSSAESWLTVGIGGGYVGYSGSTAGTFDGTEGLPAGSIRATDQFAETFFEAPADYNGDKSALIGQNLSYDIKIRYTDGAAYPAVIITSSHGWLYYNHASPPIGVWQHMDVPLVASAWRYGSWTGNFATSAQFLASMSSIEHVVINAEWKTGPDDTNLDNVVFGHETPFTAPTGYDILQGSRFSGNLASLASSDNNCLQIFDDADSLEGEIAFLASTNLLSPAKLTLRFEGHVARPGLSQLLSAYDYDLLSYVDADSREAPLSDESFDVIYQGSAPAMVGPAGELMAKILWSPINDEVPSQDGWLQCVDQVGWLAE